MQRVTAKAELGRTGLATPPIVFGTSCLGNLYRALPDEEKLQILQEMFRWVEPPVVLDSAGKYGAGLALEVIGRGLRELGAPPDQVIISNKLAWTRTPLRTPEPTFEPGAWVGLEHDAQQQISYDGILRCYEQGCELLGGDYRPQLVSVHDPDEYLAAAATEDDRRRRWQDILDAYRALGQLKGDGQVRAVGVGAKDWKVIRDLAEAVRLDWCMLACSLTIMHHPPELLAFVKHLADAGVGIINSAVFHAGFLTGGPYYDYRKVDRKREEDRPLFEWRDRFFSLCEKHEVNPAAACVQFGASAPGVCSIALNTSKPERIQQNAALVQAEIPNRLWSDLKEAELIAGDYPYLD